MLYLGKREDDRVSHSLDRCGFSKSHIITAISYHVVVVWIISYEYQTKNYEIPATSNEQKIIVHSEIPVHYTSFRKKHKNHLKCTFSDCSPLGCIG